MLEALELELFRRVLLAAVLASIACGVIGTHVVAKRISSISGGLAHAAFGGVGLAYFAGFPPMAGAAGFALAAAAAVGVAQRKLRSGLDTLISMIWAVGMALGIVFVSLAPGYTPDLTSFLFGNLLFASWDYVLLVAVLDVLIVGVAALLYRPLQAVSFDEEFAETVRLPVGGLFIVLLALTALAIVTLIRVVGVILAIALLTMPAALARQWASGLSRMMVIATCVAAACSVAGLFLSYGLSLRFGLSVPPGPLIVLLAAAAYAASSGLVRVVRSNG